jgi:cold shock CspA family protein
MSEIFVVTSTSEIQLGRVKWFNNKTGFGFITITDGINAGNDIFVHHSSINVISEQYKYLVQGEYVEFLLIETTGVKHKFQASQVKGIKGGKLMCETRKEFKVARNNYISDKLEVKGSKLSSDIHNNSQEVPRNKYLDDKFKRSKSTPVSDKQSSTQQEWTSIVKRNRPEGNDKKKETKNVPKRN